MAGRFLICLVVDLPLWKIYEIKIKVMFETTNQPCFVGCSKLFTAESDVKILQAWVHELAGSSDFSGFATPKYCNFEYWNIDFDFVSLRLIWHVNMFQTTQSHWIPEIFGNNQTSWFHLLISFSDNLGLDKGLPRTHQTTSAAILVDSQFLDPKKLNELSNYWNIMVSLKQHIAKPHVFFSSSAPKNRPRIGFRFTWQGWGVELAAPEGWSLQERDFWTIFLGCGKHIGNIYG